MHPVLVKIGPLVIRYYGLMYVVAIALGAFLFSREARRRRLPLSTEDLLDLVLVTIPAAVLGARLYYVVFQWGYYRLHPMDIFKLWEGGLAIHGGVLAGALAVYLFCRAKKARFWTVTDALVPSLILGQAIGRIGNLMNGDAYGTPTTLPWGIRFPAESPAGQAYPGLATHPTMIYESLLNFAVFVLLWGIRKRGYKDGYLTALYFLLYSVARSIVSLVRADDLYLGPIRAPHAISVLFLLGFGAFILRRRLYERVTPGSAPPGRSA
jgi:prolipoprotein diacylglyceryl transferase